jgi:AraC-like DNA-binding protein
MSVVDDQASKSPDRASGDTFGDTDPFDPLSEVLQTLRLTGSLFFVWECSSPFASPAPSGQQLAPVLLPGAQQIVSYHLVVEGECWGGLLGKRPLRLRTGDVLLVPRGHAYVMGSNERECREQELYLEPTLEWFRSMAAGEMPFVVRDGGGGPHGARIICGFLGCDVRPFNPVLSALPAAVRVPSADETAPDRLRMLAQYAVEEARTQQPGSRGVLVRLGELMFMEVVRRCARDVSQLPRGWLAGLSDPIVGRCLALIHARPHEAWTLASLADAVGCSRSGLAERFNERVGEPPIHYMTRWRMTLASNLLRDETLSVSAVAERVGYGSGPAFSRAFARLVGVSPSDWRRRESPGLTVGPRVANS